jgi:hypothetical protein
MKANCTNIINRAIVCFLLLSVVVIAHGGLEHVLGTVAKISETGVTVTTAAGKSVEITFDAKTTFTKNGQPFQKADIKVGDRVVIHAEKSGTKLVAHTVQLGTVATKTAKH